MTKRSPLSNRLRRSRPGHRGTTISPAARAILAGDYPAQVKQKVLLTARGALAGKRVCLVCGQPGLRSRVYIPGEALRVDRPDFRGIATYWICAEHSELTDADPELQRALARRARR